MSEELRSKVKRLGVIRLRLPLWGGSLDHREGGVALSACTGGGCLHRLRKGWPGTLPELSPVTHSHSGRRPGPGLDSPGLPRAQPFATVQMERLGRGGGGQEASPCSSPTEQVFSGRADTEISAPLSPEPQGPVSSRKNSPCGCARQLGSHGGGLLACRTRAAVDGSSHGLRGLLGPPVLPATGAHPSGSGLAASTRA